jgi:outer membrane protein assembly factor BamB
VQVRLLDGFAGSVHWTRALPVAEGADVQLLGADKAVTVLVGDEVQTLAGPDGGVLARLPVATGADVEQATVGSISLLRVDGTVSALDASSGAALWEVPATGLPAESGAVVDANTPTGMVLPDEQGFSSRDPATGAELERFAVAGLPDGGSSSVFGPVAVLRLDGRVLGYR